MHLPLNFIIVFILQATNWSTFNISRLQILELNIGAFLCPIFIIKVLLIILELDYSRVDEVELDWIISWASDMFIKTKDEQWYYHLNLWYLPCQLELQLICLSYKGVVPLSWQSKIREYLLSVNNRGGSMILL